KPSIIWMHSSIQPRCSARTFGITSHDIGVYFFPFTVFYRTENVFRWCEMVTEEKQVKQSIEERAATRYQALT
ncbi:hypothetical protein, partial [Gemmiger formicilis]|uniref:hypothetical protein n=1 Tax=Gemmiger formicilis TaxID=745368 RepID=UPI001958A9F2